jgi:CheY-like chemotaxis protein
VTKSATSSNIVKKVLIVEDDKDLNKAYRLILDHCGYSVDSAFNGREALTKNQQFKPDLILLDLLMPIMGGLEFLRKYYKNPKNNAEIVIFTNMEDSPEIIEAEALGARQCVVKSWAEPNNIEKIVSKLLSY